MSFKIAPVLIVHGGAWDIPDDLVEPHRQGVANALATGYALLEKGASSIDAVEAAVAVMEDDEAFDAGRGSFLTNDGRVQLDALLMDGATLRAGGIACVERLRNPIRAARLVMDRSPHVYFVGAGAEAFAAEHGMPLIDNAELVIDRERLHLAQAQTFAQAQAQQKQRDILAGHTPAVASHPPQLSTSQAGTPHDTVGAVALDGRGNLAAATSTGGTLNKAPGRVGDSSLIGCGCYADNLSAAVSLTGWGEPIMKLVLGKWAVDRVQQGTPPAQAAEEAIAYLFHRLGGHGGIILLGPMGRIGVAHNTPRMAWGTHTARGMEVYVR